MNDNAAVALDATPSAPLLIDRRQFAGLLSVSVAHLNRMRAAGLIPAPLNLGDRSPRWSRAEVEAWVEAGCPSRWKWEQTKRVTNASGRARR